MHEANGDGIGNMNKPCWVMIDFYVHSCRNPDQPSFPHRRRGCKTIGSKSYTLNMVTSHFLYQNWSKAANHYNNYQDYLASCDEVKIAINRVPCTIKKFLFSINFGPFTVLNELRDYNTLLHRKQWFS
jgi:hypothetical protein